MKKFKNIPYFILVFLLLLPVFALAVDETWDPFENPPAGAENPNAGTGEPPLTDNPNGEDLLMPAMENEIKNQDEGVQQNMTGGGIQAVYPSATKAPASPNDGVFNQEILIEQKNQTKAEMEKDVDVLFREGRKYYDTEDYAAAADIWARIITNFPTAKSIYNIRYSLANAYEFDKQYEKAIDQYQKMLGIKSKSDLGIEASYRLAGCYAKLRKWQYAIEIYRDMVRKSPSKKESIRAYFNIANIYFRMEKYKKVSNIYLSIIKNYPGSPWELQARFQLASTYAQTKRYKSSINEYKIIQYKFKDTEWAPRAALHIGDTYKLSGDYKKAKDAYSRVIYEYYKYDQYTQQAEDRIEGLKQAREIAEKYDNEQQNRNKNYIIRSGGGIGGSWEYNTASGEAKYHPMFEEITGDE